MRKWEPLLAVVWAVFLMTAGFESPSLGETVESGNPASRNSGPTAVAGESWLAHLHRTFDETSMGKTGRLGPPSAMPGAEFARGQRELSPEPANETVTVHGSDLYRMNCRGCHGEDGLGAPPEINSVINPVRATSVAAVMERMKSVGMSISRAGAANLAQQSKAMLLDRLHHGGQDMPAFPHLREAEVDALVAYLRQLAGVRGAQGEQISVQESRVRVGEHIVKSTCHICHSAAGPNPDPQQLYQGAIPPLNTLALRTSRAEFIRKVTRGAPVLMGTPPELYRGRMPVFDYLSEDEVADVYLYLERYPPYPWAILGPAIASSEPDQGALTPAARVGGLAFTANVRPAEGQQATAGTDPKLAVLPVLAGFIAIVSLGLGFGFTAFVLKGWSTANQGRYWTGRIGMGNGDAADECRERASEHVSREVAA